MTTLCPGAVIGILGGGQLARMLSMAAAQLGFTCHIFAPEIDSPAFQVSAAHTVAHYADEMALARFADVVDVITFEFENVPVAAVKFLEALKPVRPGSKALAVAQDRILEKQMARRLGALTADFAEVSTLDGLRETAQRLGLPGILKTIRMGYDGKGQAKINDASDIATAFAAMKGAPAIYETFVRFEREVSVIAARGVDGAFAAYDVVENVHRNHILHTSTVPAALPPELCAEAIFVAQRILDELDYIGVMGVEFFVGPDVLYVNEVAPRVHNSGHWTMDTCLVSQFEQHIRAVVGWPLGATLRHSDVVMTNLLGDDIDAWQSMARDPAVAYHHYGKLEARAGRKMGHINRLLPRS